MDFTAIDFETANEKRSSACALGLIVVDGGAIVEERSFLIRPKELRFNPFNISLHGIRPSDVRDEPEFNDLWDALQPYLDGRTVIAHNAGFDMGVLRALLDEYEMDHPDLRYACTMTMSRRAWPELKRHRLDVVANHLGVEFKHHDAVEDARAAAWIALHAARKFGVASFSELLRALGMSRWTLAPRCCTSP